jgi:CRISPR/Cas system CSM-associated protein Csm3 (group 7 of RAMP superfamily)
MAEKKKFKFSSLFISGGDEEETQSQPQSTQPITVEKPVVPATSVKGTIKQEFVDALNKVLEDNNAPEYDYYDFRQVLLSLKGAVSDDSVRFTTAYATAKAMKGSIEILASSAKNCLKCLADEEKEFLAAIDDKKAANDKKANDIVAATQAIQTKNEEIAKIQDEIKKLQGSIEKMQKSIAEGGEKIETAKADFAAAYDLVTGEINQDIANMKKYLK